MNIEITDFDWLNFEKNYMVSRYELVELENIYRHPCRIFVKKSDLPIYEKLHKDLEKIVDDEKYLLEIDHDYRKKLLLSRIKELLYERNEQCWIYNNYLVG